jgi:hypothetical protein
VRGAGTFTLNFSRLDGVFIALGLRNRHGGLCLSRGHVGRAFNFGQRLALAVQVFGALQGVGGLFQFQCGVVQDQRVGLRRLNSRSGVRQGRRRGAIGGTGREQGGHGNGAERECLLDHDDSFDGC